MNKLILGLIGERFAGKDVVASYLVNHYGADHFRFSHILDDMLKLLNLEISRRNEIDLGMGLRQIFGGQVLGPAIAKKVKESQKSVVVVNGIRMDEFEVIKTLGARTIYITAPAEIRFERYQQRREKADDASLNFENFTKQGSEATEINIPELGRLADFKIENIGSLEELYWKIEQILKKLKM
jgi:dephospho-CoA kinase